MEDHDHPELDFDPLDDIKIWPGDKFPLYRGCEELNKNPEYGRRAAEALGTPGPS